MTDRILSKKYIDITLVNNTTSNQRIDFAKESSNPIVDDASQYDLCIVRFKIPSASITKYKIPAGSTTDQLYMRISDVKDGTSYRMSVGSFNLAESQDINITDPRKLIDYINRGIYKTYYNFLQNYTPSMCTSGTISTYGWTQNNQTFNFPITIPSGATKIAYMTLDFDTNILIDHDHMLTDFKMSLLVNGVEIMVMDRPNYTYKEQIRHLNFQDGHLTSTFENFDLSDPERNRHPKEPFYKANDVSSWSGTPFQLKLQCSDGDPSFMLDATLHIAFIDTTNTKLPLYTPYLSVDTNNLITFNYSPSWYAYGPHIGFSDRLRNVLDSFDYYSVAQVNYLTIPQQVISTDESVNKSIKQLQSSLFRINEIDKIEFSTTIPVESESVSGTTTAGILTDFAIDPTGLTNDYYIYNAPNDYRRYRLLSNTPLRRLGFIAYAVYLDGSREVILSRPGETSSLKIQLSPSNTLIG